MEGQKEGQTIFYRTLSATARGPKKKKDRNKMDQTEQILVVKGGLGESIITENL